MKYCPNCGTSVSEEASFCPNCGCPLSHSSGETNTSSYSSYYPPVEETNGFAIAGFILSFFSPLLGWIFGGIGLGKANKLISEKGKGLSIAAIVIASLTFILNLIIIFSKIATL